MSLFLPKRGNYWNFIILSANSINFWVFWGEKKFTRSWLSQRKFGKKKKKKPNSQIAIFGPSKYIWFNNIQMLLAKSF